VLRVNMGEIPMPGGWMLSAVWVPMCGQTWLGAMASFVGMWMAMMVAMMSPSLLPVLWRQGLARGAIAASGYFAVWTALGAIVFALGAACAQAALQLPSLARAAPVAMGLVVLLAAAWQFTSWKARHLACWRALLPRDAYTVADAGTAWRYGVRLGLHCCRACASFTALLLVAGVMDWRAMAAITVAITAERLTPSGRRAAGRWLWLVSVRIRRARCADAGPR
jgi:predicted metal-binding membrane protein